MQRNRIDEAAFTGRLRRASCAHSERPELGGHAADRALESAARVNGLLVSRWPHAAAIARRQRNFTLDRLRGLLIIVRRRTRRALFR